MAEFNPPLEVTLREKKHEFGDIWSFIFDKPAEAEFLPGQYAYWVLPSLGEDEPAEHIFSIAAAPKESYLQVTTHVRAQSIYKQALAKVEMGDKIKIRKISGKFILPKPPVNAVLIAGGIGITPFRAMLRAYNGNPDYSLTLVHIAEGEFLFQDGFENMPFEQLRLNRGEIDNKLGLVIENNPTADYFISGPPSFVADLETKVKNLGITQEKIHLDEFDGYK